MVPLQDGAYNIMVSGIGGTGVVTIGALLGMAAHLEGKSTSIFDMTGLSQKNGAVFSHVRIAAFNDDLGAQKLGVGEADLALAFDAVAGLAKRSEEHTSELQSLMRNSYAGVCLKKKTKYNSQQSE